MPLNSPSSRGWYPPGAYPSPATFAPGYSPRGDFVNAPLPTLPNEVRDERRSVDVAYWSGPQWREGPTRPPQFPDPPGAEGERRERGHKSSRPPSR
jgi:hypothetical protein